jgi:hypothetical protein
MVNLISSFLSQCKLIVSVEGEMSRPREVLARVPQGSALPPTSYSKYINDAPQTPGIYLDLFAGDSWLYATNQNEGFVVRKLQHGLSSMET